MPGLTIATKNAPTRARAPSGSESSPTGPPMSPLTPTFAPAQLDGGASPQQPPSFSQDRPTFTHSQPDQIGMPPPPALPQPISFDDNPDVLALKSAISILQLQRARATRDVQSLSRARDAALADPEGFIAELRDGKIGTEGDRLFPGAARRASAPQEVDDDDDDDDDSDDDEEGDEEQEQNPDTGGAQEDSKQATTTSPRKKKRKPPAPAPPPAWRTLPKPQNVVRCPPINWSQYGVVGESLDKLHAEQLRAPTQGTPATLTPGAGGLTYEFKGDAGKQEKLVGIAAPYAPGRDKLAKKGKGGKR